MTDGHPVGPGPDRKVGLDPEDLLADDQPAVGRAVVEEAVEQSECARIPYEGPPLSRRPQ